MTTNLPAGYEWRYVWGSKVRHVVRNPGSNTSALCGLGPAWHSRWLGGVHREQSEHCATLRPCKRCVAKGAQP